MHIPLAVRSNAGGSRRAWPRISGHLGFGCANERVRSLTFTWWMMGTLLKFAGLILRSHSYRVGLCVDHCMVAGRLCYLLQCSRDTTAVACLAPQPRSGCRRFCHSLEMHHLCSGLWPFTLPFFRRRREVLGPADPCVTNRAVFNSC
jgi:hypothetical protein